MNQDILEGKWKQVKGQMRQWWAALTDDDIDYIGGKTEKLVGKLQERYGYTREEAQRDVERRLRDLEALKDPA